MKVVHITPTYFDQASVIGGGERYPSELARWMAKETDTTLVSFGPKRCSYTQDSLKVQVFPAHRFLQNNKVNPWNLGYLRTILTADVVHLHNVNAIPSVMAAAIATLLRKPCFVTDYGGGSGLGDILNRRLGVPHSYRQAIAYSQFGCQHLPSALQKKTVLIKGGIDSVRFQPNPTLERDNTILYVGRILPHKGINYLVESLRYLTQTDCRLKIMGRVYSDRFYKDLQQLAAGLPVEFIHDADDQQLLQAYQTARVTVLPSVHTTCYGDYSPVPELMGFTLLESQACGTPAICTDAGAMAEFVDNGQTGFVVTQNSPEAIATAIQHLFSLSSQEYQVWQHRCRQWAETLNWASVVDQHLQLYAGDAPANS